MSIESKGSTGQDKQRGHIFWNCSFVLSIQNTKIFPVGTSSKRPPLVSDRDHFLGLTVNDFPLFLTPGERPLDAFSDLYVCCVHYAT